jgi:hypothetical protein
MEIAMNMRAAYAMLARVLGGFDAHAVAGGVDGNVAIQDLTLKS